MEPGRREKHLDAHGHHGRQTSTLGEVKTVKRRRFRLGNLEREILQLLLKVEKTGKIPPMSKSKYWRMNFFDSWKNRDLPHVPLIWLRNQIFRARYCRDIKASDKANFSRAVKTLTEKGLVRTRNWFSARNYSTHVRLTKEGYGFLLREREKLTRKKECNC
jgi:hypothetical protein